MRRIKKVDESTGQFALRNTLVEKCIARNEVLHVHHGDEIMTMDPETLKSNQIGRSRMLHDVVEGDFFLIDYIWNPNITNDD